jgi:two-component system, OmpR family, response regulator
VVTQDDSVASHLAQQLSSQGLAAVRIAISTLGTKDAAGIRVFVVSEPIRDALAKLGNGSMNRDVAVLVAVKSQRPEIRAQWLDAGADDCISLPAHAVELAARVSALGRRIAIHAASNSVLNVGRLKLHLQRREAYLREDRLDLTSYEFDLLASLAQSAGQVLSRERLLELTRGAVDETFDRAIDVQVSRLRAKLGDDPRDPKLLKTVRGRGYLLHGT